MQATWSPEIAGARNSRRTSSDPKRASDLRQQHRYNAACSAVLTAAGKADDARLVPDKVARRLRRQADDARAREGWP